MNNFEFTINLSDKLRKDILKSLEKIDIRLAQMYEGAIHTLNHVITPNRVNLAAHSLRELIEKLPWLINIPSEEKGKLTSHVGNLRAYWETLIEGEQLQDEKKFIANLFSEEKVGATQRFILRVRSFFEAVPSKIKKMKKAFKKLHPNDEQPILVQNFQAKIWNEFYSYFSDLGHHRPFIYDEFIEKLITFEYYLSNMLTPKVFDLMKDIENVIEEGEKDAH